MGGSVPYDSAVGRARGRARALTGSRGWCDQVTIGREKSHGLGWRGRTGLAIAHVAKASSRRRRERAGRAWAGRFGWFREGFGRGTEKELALEGARRRLLLYGFMSMCA